MHSWCCDEDYRLWWYFFLLLPRPSPGISWKSFKYRVFKGSLQGRHSFWRFLRTSQTAPVAPGIACSLVQTRHALAEFFFLFPRNKAVSALGSNRKRMFYRAMYCGHCYEEGIYNEKWIIWTWEELLLLIASESTKRWGRWVVNFKNPLNPICVFWKMDTCWEQGKALPWVKSRNKMSLCQKKLLSHRENHENVSLLDGYFNIMHAFDQFNDSARLSHVPMAMPWFSHYVGRKPPWAAIFILSKERKEYSLVNIIYFFINFLQSH